MSSRWLRLDPLLNVCLCTCPWILAIHVCVWCSCYGCLCVCSVKREGMLKWCLWPPPYTHTHTHTVSCTALFPAAVPRQAGRQAGRRSSRGRINALWLCKQRELPPNPLRTANHNASQFSSSSDRRPLRYSNGMQGWEMKPSPASDIWSSARGCSDQTEPDKKHCCDNGYKDLIFKSY